MKTFEIANELQDQNLSSQERMKLMVKYLQRYMETYDQQYGYENYTDKTFIYDVVYCLGVALNPTEHQYANGFDKWKMKLIELLKAELHN